MNDAVQWVWVFIEEKKLPQLCYDDTIIIFNGWKETERERMRENDALLCFWWWNFATIEWVSVEPLADFCSCFFSFFFWMKVWMKGVYVKALT